SQFNLGFAYQTGDGVPKDPTKAADWYRKAADQGNLGAQFMLGFMYRTGEGVKIDDAEALRWYQKGAEAGDGASQSELGAMYETGRGVSRDHVEAYKWFTIALKNKGENANVNRDLLVKRMTADQIAEGERRAAAFVPKENPARHKLPSR